jgi:peptidoglycan/LPS O-acetylase OafA/YrhL
VALVVAYHADHLAVPGGFVGVDVFFVVSGFLITRLLVDELQQARRISLARFYARRARRILPAATLVSVVTVMASAFVSNPFAARATARDALSASYFGFNYRLAAEGSNYLTASVPVGPLQHYWSLSVEEQFYVVWPALLLLASLAWWRRRSPSIPAVAAVLGTVAVVSFAVSVRQASTSPSWAYYSLLSRAWELAAGALVGLALPRLRRLAPAAAGAIGWLGLAGIVVAGFVFSGSTPWPSWAALLPVGATAAVIVSGSGQAVPSAGPERLLGTPVFRYVGRISYSWYLWHFPVLVLAPAALGHALSPLQTIAAVALSFALAVVTYTLVEQPFRHWELLVRRPRRGLALGGALVSVAVVAAVAVPAAMPALAGTGPPAKLPPSSTLTLPALQSALDIGLALRAVPVNVEPPVLDAPTDLPIVYDDGCALSYAPTSGPPCVFGDKTATRTVVLFGDSHAAQWFPALVALSDRYHWRLVSLTKSGCPAPAVAVDEAGSAIPYTQCNVWRTWAEHRIDELRPALVVVSWKRSFSRVATAVPGVRSGSGGPWLDGVGATFTALKASGAEVVFISDTPAGSGPACVATHLSDVTSCDVPASRAVTLPGVKREEISLSQAMGVQVIDPTAWFCTARGCPAIVGNVLVYRDSDHVIPQYVEWLAPLLGADLISVLRS